VSQLPKNAIGEVLPSTLFDNPHLRGLLNPNRSYSPLLDTLIKRRGANAQITMVSPSMGGANILKMLTLNRGDYTIEYDFGFAYQMSLDPSIAAANLQSLPIAGGVTSPSGCFCPRTEWGRAAIQKIDSLMVKIAADPELRNAYYRWLTPETVKSYRPELEQFFRDRLRPTNPAKFAPP
jgi:uncharacterized protein (TIGR02285 family)